MMLSKSMDGGSIPSAPANFKTMVGNFLRIFYFFVLALGGFLLAFGFIAKKSDNKIRE